MSNWQEQAIKALEDSLHPVPQELNGIDWKCALSDKSDRLAQHICAFSNTANGGFLVFGVNDDTTFTTLSKNEIEEITNKLGNIAKNNLAWSVQLEHTVVDYQGHVLLFIRIPEQTNKPIYLRGKDIYEAYIRSAGHTVKMSKEQVHELIAQSHGLSFEDRVAKSGVNMEEIENLLDCQKMFELLGKTIPSDKHQKMKLMEEYGVITERNDLYDILNLGAILFAKQIKDFPTLKGKEIIVADQTTVNGESVGEGWYMKPATMYAISKDTDHAKEAGMLLDFLMNSKEMAELQGIEKGIPLSSSARETLSKNGMLSGIQFEASEKMDSAPLSELSAVLENGGLIDDFFAAATDYIYDKKNLSAAAYAFCQKADSDYFNK